METTEMTMNRWTVLWTKLDLLAPSCDPIMYQTPNIRVGLCYHSLWLYYIFPFVRRICSILLSGSYAII
jgi:hypothetical protein